MAKEPRILIVEDDASLRSVFEAFLTQEGFLVEVASNGLEGLAMVNRNQGAYFVVFTDCEMPGLDGIALIRQAAPEYPSTKFVLMSGVLDPSMREEALDAGAYETLEKPFKLDLLGSIVEKVREPAQG